MVDVANNKTEEKEFKLDEHNLGIAGRITRQFINSPVTPLLLVAFLIIGLMGLMFTPRQEDPKISVPLVDILVQYPGASAEQMANLAINPLERMISEIPGIRHVYSASQRGSGVVTAQFYVGEDLGESIVKVHDKIQSNIDAMPPGVSMPIIKPVGPDDVPVMTATIWSKDPSIDDSILRTLSLDILQKLEQVPNSGKGFVVGGRAEQIRIEVSPERLNGFGISIQDVANTIRTANSERAAGSIEGGNRTFNVYTGAFLNNAQDVSNLVVAVRDGTPVYVRDIARIYQAAEETSQIVNYMTGPAYQGDAKKTDSSQAVTIAVAKKVGTNGVTISKQLIAKLESLKGHLIPDNIEVSITRDYGKSANDKVNELLLALFEATVAVSILCLIGLGARAASVVIIVIPVVILMTVWVAWIIDYTIDRVSLFALVFTIGILVDDATVVVENIFRRWLVAGKTTTNIAIDAVREVGNPTIMATLSIIAALMAMGFVSGLMGPYMRPIPVLGSAAMLLSLFAAFIFVPWFAMRLRPNLQALKKAEIKEKKQIEAIARFYVPIMQPLYKNKIKGKVFLWSLIVLTALSCSLFYTKSVTVKMLPFDNKPEFNVLINMPEGSALPVTANLTSRMAEKLRSIPEITAIQTYVGTASPFNFNGMVRHYYMRKKPWQADIQVMLLDKNDRQRLSHEIAVNAREILKPIADEMGAKIQVVEMPPGPPALQTVVAEIYGPDAETRRQVAADMTSMFEKAEGIVDVDNFVADEYEYWRFEVDTKKAARRGISVNTINKSLAMIMGGYKLGDVKKGRMLEATYIVIQASLGVRSEINRLGNMPITGVNGESIPLTELGRFVRATEDPIVYHKNLRDVEYVTGEMTGRLGAPIYGMFAVEDLLEQYTSPDGVQISGMPSGLIGPPADDFQSGFEWSGEWTVTYETFRDMGGAFMAAMLLIYALIVWEFKDFSLGGLIMAPIPLTLIGIIPGHWVTGAEFTATSMIGFIALAGIVVRNSILLVEFVKHEVEQGVEIHDAVINAGKARMRPILITALTLMAGSYMILDDLIFKGMAVSLLFGAGVATVLTLVVIPLGCISLKKHFYECAGADGEKIIHRVEKDEIDVFKLPFWMRVYNIFVGIVTWSFYIARMIIVMLKMVYEYALDRYKSGSIAEEVCTDPPIDVVGETPLKTNKVDDEINESVVKKENIKKSSVRKKAAVKKATVKKVATDKVATKKNTKKKSSKKIVKKRRGIQLKNDFNDDEKE